MSLFSERISMSAIRDGAGLSHVATLIYSSCLKGVEALARTTGLDEATYKEQKTALEAALSELKKAEAAGTIDYASGAEPKLISDFNSAVSGINEKVSNLSKNVVSGKLTTADLSKTLKAELEGESEEAKALQNKIDSLVSANSCVAKVAGIEESFTAYKKDNDITVANLNVLAKREYQSWTSDTLVTTSELTIDEVIALSGYPYSEWGDKPAPNATAETKEAWVTRHVGDTYIVGKGATSESDRGDMYRFARVPNGKYGWVKVADNDGSAALSNLTTLTAGFVGKLTDAFAKKIDTTAVPQKIKDVVTGSDANAVAIQGEIASNNTFQTGVSSKLAADTAGFVSSVSASSALATNVSANATLATNVAAKDSLASLVAAKDTLAGKVAASKTLASSVAKIDGLISSVKTKLGEDTAFQSLVKGKDGLAVRPNLLLKAVAERRTIIYVDPGQVGTYTREMTGDSIMRVTASGLASEDYNAGRHLFAYIKVDTSVGSDAVYLDNRNYLIQARIRLVSGVAKVTKFGNREFVASATIDRPLTTNWLDAYAVNRTPTGYSAGFSVLMQTGAVVEVEFRKIEDVTGEEQKPTAYIPHTDDLKADPVFVAKELNAADFAKKVSDVQGFVGLVGNGIKLDVGSAIKKEVGDTIKADVGAAIKLDVGTAIKKDVGDAIKAEVSTSTITALKEDTTFQTSVKGETGAGGLSVIKKSEGGFKNGSGSQTITYQVMQGTTDVTVQYKNRMKWYEVKKGDAIPSSTSASNVNTYTCNDPNKEVIFVID